MASELYVETLKGLTSGANANKVIVPAGQTLYAPGHVIQVVTGTTSTQVDNTTTSYADTGLTASITCSSTSSKVLVLVTQQTASVRSGSTYTNSKFKLLRDSTSILEQAGDAPMVLVTNGTAIRWIGNLHYEHLDSPSSTSALTYKTQVASSEANVVTTAQYNSRPSSIMLMEIAG